VPYAIAAYRPSAWLCIFCLPCRRLLLCPRGLHSDKSYVSVFLDSPEAGWVPDHLNPKASFKLYLLNQAGSGEDFCKGRRTGEDWGL
jgi:hypothetical protein